MKPVGCIILEGVSGSGKTFLAEAIRKRYPGTYYVHCKYRFKNRMWLYHLAAVCQALRAVDKGRLAVVDRNWLSESIYGEVYRNGTNIPLQGRIVQKLLLKHAVLNVVCLLSDEQTRSQIAEHRKQYHSPQFLPKAEQVADLYRRTFFGQVRDNFPNRTYADFLQNCGGADEKFNWLKYSIFEEGRSVDAFIDKITGRLAELRAQQYQPALQYSQRNVAGYLPTARYLLVGDQVNAVDYRKAWPFMEHANSSLFLEATLQDLCVDEDYLMWTNVNCPEQHAQRILAHKKIPVIALGREAERSLKRLDVPVSCAVAHPSYARRFLGSEIYAARLEEAFSKEAF